MIFNACIKKNITINKKTSSTCLFSLITFFGFSTNSYALTRDEVEDLWNSTCGSAAVIEVLSVTGADNAIGTILLAGVNSRLPDPFGGYTSPYDVCKQAQDAAQDIWDQRNQYCDNDVYARLHPDKCGGGVPDPKHPTGGADRDVRQPPGIKSPLVIDFGYTDSIETSGLEQEIYFDHNADGIVERTGWVAGFAGLLVLDLNSDGLINSGRELFGDSTLVSTGETAENGFLALQDYDLDANGIIDANDPVFTDLQVWVDFLPDGISAPFELYQFSEMGIRSIDLNYRNGYLLDEHLNEHRQRSSVTFENGEQSLIEDIWFTVNEDFEKLAVPEDFLLLPDVKGVGNVRSLHQALVLDNYGKLYTAVNNYLDSTPEQREQNLVNLLLVWTGADEAQYPVFHALESVWAAPGYLDGKENAKTAAKRKITNHYKNLLDVVHFQLSSKTYLRDLFYDLSVFYENPQTSGSIANFDLAAAEINRRIVTDTDGQSLNLFNDFARALRGIDPETEAYKNAFLDTYIAQQLDVSTSDAADTVNLDQHQAGLLAAGLSSSESFHVETLGGDDQISMVRGNVIISSGAGNDVITLQYGNDVINAGDGNDMIEAGEGNDIVNGEAGDDTIIAEYVGNKQLHGGAGNDTIQITRKTMGKQGFSRPATFNNVLSGGQGNDRLEGWAGADTYLFNAGDGQDVINDSANIVYSYSYKNRPRGGTYVSTAVDRIQFGEGISSDDLQITRDTNNLVITFNTNTNANDRITVENWFVSPSYRIEEFVFADASVLVESDISARVISSLVTESADTISAWGIDLAINSLGGDDVITSETGNIRLNTGAGDDQINLGNGRDRIHAGSGHDLIESGDGDDTIYGEQGNDDINSGNGDDTVYGGADNDTIETGIGNDIANGDAGDDLITTAYTGNKQLHGGAGNDTIQITRLTMGKNGYKQPSVYNNIFSGGTGNDRLEGWASSDTYLFNIGDGQDVINDQAGVVYRYTYKRRSKGGTYISPTAIDRLQFGEGISPDDLIVTRDADHLVINFTNQVSDRITIENWFTSPSYRIEEFIFADTSVLLESDIAVRVVSSLTSEGNDTVNAWGRDLTINTLGGDDVITSLEGNITLNAGAGHDQINLGTGNDLIHAGSGNDIVQSGDGNDTVYGEQGDDDINSGRGNDIVDGGVGNDIIDAGYDDDTINGGDGNDIIETGDGNDVANGDAGDDQITSAFAGNKQLHGGSGDDTIKITRMTMGKNGYSRPATFSNTLSGGQGNDRLEGWAGADTYLFNVGDGQDVINDRGNIVYSYTYKSRPRGGTYVSTATDRLQFGEGIISDHLVLTRDADHLVITFTNHESDQILIENWFVSNDYRLEEFVFADTTVLLESDISARVVEPEPAPEENNPV